MENQYDIIVVGAGHAGCEAAAAASNLGSRVLLITMDMTKVGQMSCNPAIGGIAKGQIVREIDALGGYTGIVTDRSSIQFRMLNRSKGPAMWSPRAQCDRTLFTIEWRKVLESIENLDLWQDAVVGLVVDNNVVTGVKTRMGVEFSCRSVILTNGTFINGLIHVGSKNVSGGRSGEPASFGISEQLKEIGFEVGRMKTGTPARIDGRSVDFSVMEPQYGDESPSRFSYISEDNYLDSQLPCYITYTNPKSHEILEKGFNESPLFSGKIQGIGPRYCPSIEDKIVTFSEKTRHQLFLEPEGLNTVEYYLNGFSSSLPLDVQLNALRKVKGLENVKIYRPGYAIEYDYYPPTQLFHTLETRLVSGLYFAGQINGTTGYEEAGAQGLIAGINAHLKLYGKSTFVLKRDESYIGVLIDDLITKGVDEPYRMFTSRAEYRILLRQDNADTRLTRKSYEIGLATKERVDLLDQKERIVSEMISFLKKKSVLPTEINSMLIKKGTSEISQKVKLIDILLRPQVSLLDLSELFKEILDFSLQMPHYQREIVESVEIIVKYSGYIDREREMAGKISRLDEVKISENFDYDVLHSISTEGRQKLKKFRPSTIGQASRISGVSPADISVLLIYLGR
jgi:tRNA uridine 5-carboxymethylaminomethyl modification enzyme